MPKKYVVLPSILSALALAVAVAASGTFATAQGPVVGADVPTGAVVPYAGSSPPNGYLLANGEAVNRADYPQLFAVIGTTYGPGNGTTTFNLPNMEGRFPLGKADSGTGDELGEPGGTLNHSHSVASHSHALPGHFHGKGTLSVGGGDHQHQMVGTSTFGSTPIQLLPVVAMGTNDRPWSSGLGGASHSHDVSGNVGATGSGNNGDGTLNSGSTTGTSGTANPPFLTLNYVIRTGEVI
jgi:microcystin-dependent protein